MIRRARVGVVVLDHERPADAARAAQSARDASLDNLVLIVENGAAGGAESTADRLRLPHNLGFAAGMNAGIRHLAAQGCERFLLLNSDAVLAPDCLRLLSAALDVPTLAAVGPVILRDADGRVESQGARVNLRSGRVRLVGHGKVAGSTHDLARVQALSGAVMMVSLAAFERVGPLDEDYFFSFEDVDWCLRARTAGFELAVVGGARARHAGSLTIGRGSPARLYYAARNHLRMVEKLAPERALRRWGRRGLILMLNLAQALKQRDVPRLPAVRAVIAGLRDAHAGRTGRRHTGAA